MKKIVVVLIALFYFWQDNALASSKTTADCIRNPECSRTFIVAHRGNGLGAPENSREAAKLAVEYKIDVIEIDVQKSKDGYLYALHDRALNRTVSQKGKIQDKLSLELENAFLENGETLPMLQDIYDISHSKAVLDLDFKVNAVEQVAEWVAEAGSFDDFIFFVDTIDEMKSAAEMKTKYPDMIVMARLNSRTTLETILKIFGENPPEIIHTDFQSAENVEWLHSLNRKVFANSLGPDRMPWPISSIATHILQVSGVNFIQTDKPLEWIRKLKRQKRTLEKKYNFGVVYENKLLRSGAPSKEFLEYLKINYNLTIIIDLKNPNSFYENWRIKQESEWAKELGLKYVLMTTTSSGAKKHLEKIRKFMKNPENKILIHCQAGKDRTGAVIAFLRMQDGWTYEKARKEMKRYGHNPETHERFHKYLRIFAAK